METARAVRDNWAGLYAEGHTRVRRPEWPDPSAYVLLTPNTDPEIERGHHPYGRLFSAAEVEAMRSSGAAWLPSGLEVGSTLVLEEGPCGGWVPYEGEPDPAEERWAGVELPRLSPAGKVRAGQGLKSDEEEPATAGRGWGRR